MTVKNCFSAQLIGKSRLKLHLTVILLGILLALIERVGASTEAGTQHSFNPAIESVVFILFFVILLFNYQTHRNLGNSIISLPFIYMLFGLTLTIAARGLLFLQHLGVYNEVPIMVINIYWHFFLYLSMIIFILAIEKVADRMKDKELRPISRSDITIFSTSTLITIFLFLTPSTIGMNIMMAIMGTFIPKFGVLHILAFVFAFLVSVRYIQVINKTKTTPVGKYMKTISIPFLLFLIITTLHHLTALIVETWALITVDNLELIEQGFWVVAFLVMAYGYYVLTSEVRKSTDQEDDIQEEISIEKYDNETALIIMDILTEHIGNLAFSVIVSSSRDSGISINEVDTKNIKEFSEAVEKNTTELIGQFPSRYLKVTLQRIIAG